ELALEDGVATKTHVLNVLHRLMDSGGAAAIIDAPQALVLRQEPKADIERYDALRDREMRHAS
ncbi:MAG: IS21 family transposase, partial [Deltaproteobacteria bacterium]